MTAPMASNDFEGQGVLHKWWPEGIQYWVFRNLNLSKHTSHCAFVIGTETNMLSLQATRIDKLYCIL